MTIVYTEEEVSKMKPVKNVKMIKKKTFHPFEKMISPIDVMKLGEVNLDDIR